MAFTIRTSAILRRLLAGRRSPNSVPLSWQRGSQPQRSRCGCSFVFQRLRVPPDTARDKRISAGTEGGRRRLTEPDKIPLFRITTWRQRPCEATTLVLRMYCREAFAQKKASCFRRCRMPGKKPERSWKNRGGTESARIHPAEKGAGAGNNPGEGPEICGRGAA